MTNGNASARRSVVQVAGVGVLAALGVAGVVGCVSPEPTAPFFLAVKSSEGIVRIYWTRKSGGGPPVDKS
jgi:hypothetical protein